MRRRRFLAGSLAATALPFLIACGPRTPSNRTIASTAAPPSPTALPRIPTAFADTGALPGTDFMPESFTWLRGRYLVGCGGNSWWYGNPQSGEYRYFTAVGPEAESMELVVMNSAEDFYALQEQLGPANVLTDEIMVVDAESRYGYIVTTTVRAGTVPESTWQAHVLKVDLEAATVRQCLALDVEADVDTAIGNWAMALNAAGTRLSLASGNLSGACHIWAVDTASMQITLKDPHHLGNDEFHQISGDAVVTGTSDSGGAAEGSYPPYIVYSLETGNMVSQENNLDTYLLGSWLYWLETAYDAWRIMDVTIGEEVTLTDQPPVGAPDARPKVWETGGYSVVHTDSALDVRPLGSPTAALSLSADAGDTIPAALAVHRDVVYAAYPSAAHELQLIDLTTGEQLATARLGTEEDGIDREPQTLAVAEVGAGYFYTRGGACTFHAATDWLT
ncbi:hypothetical protein [Actinomyces qiguomingii]|uniref:hypothetical protein n=1 Tax=Actinomyces qiguomingii TaxID=2057800 RepID=UPI000CA00F7F|nr:hypothetical protein [Actinomyces qiguomingii]